MHKNREKSTMRQEVNRADIGGKSGNKVKRLLCYNNSLSAKSNKKKTLFGLF